MSESGITSLEELSGIGEERAGALRNAGFEGIDDVRRASVVEVSAIEGINEHLARSVKDEAGEFRIADIDPEVIEDIRDRLKVREWERWYWRRRPARVKILLYAEGSIKFNGGGFGGLTHVIATLTSDPWFWVKFDVTLAHRGTDPNTPGVIENVDLDELDLEDHDELWLFGIAGGDLLSSDETRAVEEFMDAGGGVVTTGDHYALGQGITGSIDRVGKMRNYDEFWNTLRVGSNEQDDVPQDIRIREYPTYHVWPRFLRRTYPHPVLCGPEGPIEILPDHQHEGEVNVPSSYPTDEWPEKNGYQPEVEPIAWARIVQGDDSGTEFPVVGVYNGHRADVGRIAADATWHHWFDLNLLGGNMGFDDTTSGLQALEQFESYFLNLAVWLAPPDRQRAMRNALLWGGFWRGPLVMFDVEQARNYSFGGRARDALGQFAPQCQIDRWWLDLVPIDLEELLNELRVLPDPIPEPEPGPGPIPLPIEEFMIGATVRTLLEEFDDAEDIVEYPGDEILEEAFEQGMTTGIEELVEYHEIAMEQVDQIRQFT